MTIDPRSTTADAEHTLRIGEVAKLCGVTTRTLRYWEEIGLLAPSEQRYGSERVYTESEVERAKRIRELQALMGFSLAEIGVVLETEDVLDKLRSAYKANARPELQRQAPGQRHGRQRHARGPSRRHARSHQDLP